MDIMKKVRSWLPPQPMSKLGSLTSVVVHVQAVCLPQTVWAPTSGFPSRPVTRYCEKRSERLILKMGTIHTGCEDLSRSSARKSSPLNRSLKAFAMSIQRCCIGFPKLRVLHKPVAATHKEPSLSRYCPRLSRRASETQGLIPQAIRM